MLTLDRDRQIVLSVGRFGQLATAQISELHFAGLKSSTPMKRTLERLVERRYLARIERRMVGGTGAGSGQYVYQLGSAGWTFMARAGRYYPYRAVNYHTLAIADAYLELLALERENRIQISAYTTEPDSHTVIAGIDLRPDLFVSVDNVFERTTTPLWIEVDMGTERQAQIKQKLVAYWDAYQNVSIEEYPQFPLVVFLAPDDMRARELRYLVERGRKEAQQLFIVSTVSQYARLIFA